MLSFFLSGGCYGVKGSFYSFALDFDSSFADSFDFTSALAFSFSLSKAAPSVRVYIGTGLNNCKIGIIKRLRLTV